ncbi:hypothetical protein MW887_004857 [Aspergillus wentii]|nr:hypothetical protein MW887_004857 [Aspergillus wentii]
MAGFRRLQNKVAIVTGSSSGLGRAISLRYAREGAKVVCADLSPSPRLVVPGESEPTHEVILSSQGKSIFVPADVGEAKQMKELVQKTVAQFGRLDIMVNNAGIGSEAKTPAPCHLTEESMWDDVMRVNAKSVFLGCKYATGQMLQQDPHPSGDRGWIINTSSIMGIIAGQDAPAYCASKGAVALDYASHRIHVNALCPGYTQTAIFKDTTTHMTPLDVIQRRHPFNGPGYPDDIARMAVVLASDDANWMTGVCLPVDGGYTAR